MSFRRVFLSRALIAFAFLCGALVALSGVAVFVTAHPPTGAAQVPSTNSAQFLPPCPHTEYGVDGNMSPLFCVIDNPLALRYFASMGRHTFALGPDATPEQIASALRADDTPRIPLPILCSIYQLASRRNQWGVIGASALSKNQFIDGVGEELHAYHGWCSDPDFNV